MLPAVMPVIVGALGVPALELMLKVAVAVLVEFVAVIV